MDKKLLDKLNGFNLSMQQKMQLVELVKEAGGGTGNGDGDSSEKEIIKIFMNYDAASITVKLGDIEYSAQYTLNGETETLIKSNDIYNLIDTNVHKDAILYINSGDDSNQNFMIYNIITKVKVDNKINYIAIFQILLVLVFEPE